MLTLNFYMFFSRNKKISTQGSRYSMKGEPILRRVPFAGSVSGNRNRRGWRRKLVVLAKILGWLVVIGIVLGFFGGAVVFAWVSRDLPDPNRLMTRTVQKSTKIWDRTGSHLLYEIHGDQQRTVVQIKDIAPAMIHATVAAEDKNFYTNRGVQLQSFARATFDAVFRGRRLEGTSTITQQVVKNVILSNERSLTRKVKEVILAYEIDGKFTKDQILQIYFNETPYGGSAYGVEAAAQMYFGKSAKNLDNAEAALLEAIVPAPSRLSPYGSNTAELKWREQHVLDVMHDQGYLNDADWKVAKAEDVLTRVKPHKEAIFAPHFSLYVKELLADQYGEAQVEQGGLNVITTLDYDKQVLAEKAVDDGMPVVQRYGGTNAGLVSIDPKTGQVLALVGSHDYFDTAHDGNVDVIFSQLQPGSSIKPIVYATALEKGYTPDTVVFDVNTSFPTDDPAKPFTPHDYDLGERGPVPMRKALAGSLNVPAVKFLYLTGIPTVLDSAKKFGYSTIRGASNYGLSFVLGGVEVKPIEHVAAYAVFATEGTYRPPAFILKVTDADNKTLQEWQDTPTSGIIQTETARNMSMMLSDNDQRTFIFGAQNHLTLPDRPVAAKSGTTNDFVDAWTMGYTPSLVTGVWVGNNNHSKMKAKADGSTVAAPIWQEYMTKALAGTPVETFTAPQPIVTGKPVLDGAAGETTVQVDKYTGKLATNDTPPSAVETRTYRQAHDILQYVNKDDPRGPAPTDPTVDPQYGAWEAGVQDWAARNGWTSTEAPPTATDAMPDGTQPTVSFADPTDATAIGERSFHVRAVPQSATRPIKRVEFYLEGVLLGTSTSFPWEATISVPSTFDPGFYTLRAVAYDDQGSWGSTDITINSQIPSVPLQFNWLRPASDSNFPISSFPFFVDTKLSEHLGISEVDLVASATDGTMITMGSLKNPATNGVSVSWDTPPSPGLYLLKANVQTVFGTTQSFEGPTVTLK